MTVEELASWIEENFTSAGDFATWLAEAKIRGRMFSSLECPLSRLGNKRVEGCIVTVGIHAWYWVKEYHPENKFSIPLQPIAWRFREAFDKGQYPQLVG